MIDVPFKIAFKYMPKDDELTKFIERRVARLERIYSRMITGSVFVEKSQRRNEMGSGIYLVRLEMFVPPRKELVVKREARIRAVFPNLAPLITEAFEAAETELQKEKTKHSGSHMGHQSGKTRTAAGELREPF
jgi:ribosome-associated translation inhibitor RaiA